MKEEINKIIDDRDGLNADNSVAVPNDLMDKYMKLFDEKQLEAVMDLIKQTYKAGLEIGRNESPLFAIIPMSILENQNLSANAKLLYGEIMALSKKSGKCYATNEHLGKILGLKRESIPQLLRELSGNGLVFVDIKRTKDGTYRDIRVLFFDNGGYGNLTMGGMAEQQGQKRNRQIEIDKENTNLATPSVAGKDINLLIEMFKEVNPSYVQLFKRPPQRQALERMLKLHGQEKLEWAIKILDKTNKMPFSPTITTPTQLENKLGDLIAFCQKEKIKSDNKKNTIVSI